MDRADVVFLGVVGGLVVGASVAGLLFVSGYGPKETAQPYVQPVAETNLTVEATYMEENESVLLTVTGGRMTASAYDFVWIENPESGAPQDATLRAPDGGTVDGRWVDGRGKSVTEFPLREGDSVVVLRVDTVDEDDDGFAGVDSGDYLHIEYGNHGEEGAYEKKDLGYWTIENESVVRLTKPEYRNRTS